MRKHLLPILVTILSAIVIADLIAYTAYDNARFTVTRQEVVIPGLPEAFNGFTILQVSDLHSTEFGTRESSLTTAINGLSYDLIAFTGDMQDRKGNMQPFLDLVRGIRHDDRPMLFVAGNSGPEDVDLKAGYIYDEGLRLQNEGLTLMDRPFSIERGGARLWFSEVYDGITPAEMIRQARERIDSRRYQQMDSYYADQILFLTELQGVFDGITADDTLIGITHDPLTKAQLDNPRRASLPLDLVIAGHYHGGQIRVPGIGALYIPSPDERLVSGGGHSAICQPRAGRGRSRAIVTLPAVQYP
jgi:predicted MPP superfamily phosphohydrolase